MRGAPPLAREAAGPAGRPASLRSVRRVLALLAVLMVAGGALRAAEAASPSKHQSADERAYIGLARGLVDKDAYGAVEGMDDPAHWVPGAPLMFAVGYRLSAAPGRANWDVPAVYVEQAIVGTLTIGATFLLGMLLAGPVAGLIAAAIIAFYTPLLRATGDMLSEPLGALLITSAMAATVWAMKDPRPRRALVCGLLLAATVLTRADLALAPGFGLVAVGIAAWRQAEAGRRPRTVAVALAPLVVGAAVLLVPWSIVASTISDRFVPLSSGGQSVFFMGTYLPGDGSLFGAKKALAAETVRRDPSLAGRRYFQLRQLDVIKTVAARRPDLPEGKALSAAGWQNLRTYAVHQPVAYAEMMVRKAWRLWGSYTIGTFGQVQPLVRAYHLLVVALGLVGLVAGLALGRGRRGGFLVVLAVLLYATAVNMVLVSEARHNMPLMPLVAAVGVAGVVLGVRELRARRTAAPEPGSEPATLPAS